ncbi:hypothetical protein G3N55_06345 [Dissulfurirhabdus thermomarina]|uniref:Uncharacterized protein n=1 Tax=Dissulfurirhabdus thermomarina TaxID=1765737 RepID=A0A6N9TME7_DISTH|nr:sirohydrochlorin cobaltochelatase [Dissulfurirhabdus thermomarina]NDY42461.1 hypothetical protein [Dissulfurirhabdus thermomarina]NMX23849.1 hypothetical protein [Dissulfurirhabdus thermomarina]
MRTAKGILAMATAVLLLAAAGGAARGETGGVVRFLKPRYAPVKPAIVLAAFGTSTTARATFDVLDRRIRAAFPGHEVRWAFTSRIIREKVNRRRADADRLRSLPEVLAALQAEGVRQVVVQSMHVFPGGEYVHMQRQARMEGLQVAVGEPLLATWEDAARVFAVLEREFPAPDEGCVVLAGHGTPNTYYAPSTAVYLALDRWIHARYPNVYLGSVEGVPDRKDALDRAKAHPGRRVRIVPFMLVAGDHVMNDIMGEAAGEGEEASWAEELRRAGKVVDCPTVKLGGKVLYKGLGLYDVTAEILVEHIRQALRDFPRW